jgi:hypothetical protein
VRQIHEHLGDPALDGIGPKLALWADEESERLGRTHTVVKRLESLIKPAIRFAVASGAAEREPIYPAIRSDYKAEGARKHHFSREEFAALRAELPEIGVLESDAGPSVACFPRLWCDGAVGMGLHAADLDRFALDAAGWDRAGRRWFRRNEKAAAHYRPEWLPCTPFLQATFERAAGMGRAAAPVLVADAPPPHQWMRRRLLWAAHRAGICTVKRKGKTIVLVKGWIPAPIDFRRTCATWLREEGWEFDEVAVWLGNSTGIVREVYAQMPAAAMVRAVRRSSGASRNLLKMTRELEGPRRGPVSSAASGSVSSSKLTQAKGLTHGKLSKEGGGPTD